MENKNSSNETLFLEGLEILWLVRRALVAFGKETKSVDLANKVDHTCPSSEPKSNNEYPNHHKYVYAVSPQPSSHHSRRPLHRILFMVYQNKQQLRIGTKYCCNIFYINFETI